MEIHTLEKDLEEAAVIVMALAADSLDASSLKSSKELVSSNMKGKLDSINEFFREAISYSRDTKTQGHSYSYNIA